MEMRFKTKYDFNLVNLLSIKVTLTLTNSNVSLKECFKYLCPAIENSLRDFQALLFLIN